MPKEKKELPEETLERELQCWRMRVKGKTQAQIAQALGVTQPCVSQMLRRARTKYTKEFLKDIKLVKAEQMAWHRKIYFEAMRAWDKSKKAEIVIKDKGGDDRVIECTGNHNYLFVALKTGEAIRKIVGLEALVSINAKLKGKKDDGGGSEGDDLATFTITIPNANSTGNT
jgi:predicted DNA-binding protein (UPF0251 family)